jgi:glycosyltransferase involved in cell wall biosynthesis
MNSQPFFSVVIPTYNRADLLSVTVESVLGQQFGDFEILVVDNCSTDHTEQVMQGYTTDKRVRYIRNERNMERSYSRNVGMANASGQFLTLLDSDDIMYPHCLQDAYDYASVHAPKIFHNLYELMDAGGNATRARALPPIVNQYKEICKGNFLSCIGVFLDREIYSAYRFTEDPLMIGSEDYEIWFRVLARYPVGRVAKINCAVREHPGRSVYNDVYKNLEYQRQKLVGMIRSDELLLHKYHSYIGYINSNYFFHQAMYALFKNRKREALGFLSKSIVEGKGMLFSKRFLAFTRNYFVSFFTKPSNTIS